MRELSEHTDRPVPVFRNTRRKIPTGEQGEQYPELFIQRSAMLLLNDTDSLTAEPQSSSLSSESVPSGEGSSAGQRWPVSSRSAEGPLRTAVRGVRKRSSRPPHLRRNIRKLLRSHQLDEVTKLVQEQELERLNHQRADVISAPSLVYTNKADSHSCKGENEEAVSDDLNQSDAQGRVLINVSHPVDECDIFLPAHLSRVLKPHQIGGIRFLFANVVESVKRFQSSAGLGCILAHAMGLGKTLQVIAFIDVLLRHTAARTILIIVPVNTLQNWLSEFNLWFPPAESFPSDQDCDHITTRSFKVHILNDEHKTLGIRAGVLQNWHTDGGVLLVGYEMYRLLALKRSCMAGRRKKNKTMSDTVIRDLEEDHHQQELLKGIERALCRPGPDVVICDEGHRIKNCHASTSQALKSIRTRRRVVLTGYPLQNNLQEYWCMVDFVRPDFLGTRQEFSNMFERPILNGQCVDSTAEDVQLMRHRSHVLHRMLEGFVQRRGHDVLRSQLPKKQEHVILVRLSALQRRLYTEFMRRFTDVGGNGGMNFNPLKAFCICCKIWNHPDVLYEALQKESLANDQDLDLDEDSPSKASEMASDDGGLTLQTGQVFTYEWARDIMADYRMGILENSAKMVLLFHIIDESVKTGDKILVFSQSLSTLTVIEEFLSRRSVPLDSEQQETWTRNKNYYRLDGSTSASERERLINQFNDPSNTSAWVFLLSTRAGCLGVNLIGANRVVVFDASWNPCHDAQAVCRVYRYGQSKQCHIYRLVCDFTLEKKIYDRQISKQGMSDRVVDGLNPVSMFTRREVESLLQFVEEKDAGAENVLQTEDMETLIRGVCVKHPHLITRRPLLHESLLLDQQEEQLSSREMEEAQRSYEEEKRAAVAYTRPSYSLYYPSTTHSLTDPSAFSQRSWRPPQWPENKQSPPRPKMPSCSSPSAVSFPIGCLLKAGVSVQKIITSTDIVIPNTNSSTGAQTHIRAGESIHVIRGAKGTYIRTRDGRIFAVRAAVKPKQEESALVEESLRKNTVSSIQTLPPESSEDETPLDLRGTKRRSDGCPVASSPSQRHTEGKTCHLNLTATSTGDALLQCPDTGDSSSLCSSLPRSSSFTLPHIPRTIPSQP